MTPKFAKVEPADAPDLQGTIPEKLLGPRHVVQGWWRKYAIRSYRACIGPSHTAVARASDA
jgi:hypothetical protein